MNDRWTKISLLTLLACCLAAGGALAAGQGTYSAGLFQLGDGLAPPGFRGAADILGTPGQSGPDWADLFTAEGRPRDIGRYGGRWAVFIADDVSMGSGFEGTALAGSPDLVRNGKAAAAHDIGNAYAYGTKNAAGQSVLYLGVERLSGSNSYVEFELNQAVARRVARGQHPARVGVRPRPGPKRRPCRWTGHRPHMPAGAGRTGAGLWLGAA